MSLIDLAIQCTCNRPTGRYGVEARALKTEVMGLEVQGQDQGQRLVYNETCDEASGFHKHRTSNLPADVSIIYEAVRKLINCLYDLFEKMFCFPATLASVERIFRIHEIV